MLSFGGRPRVFLCLKTTDMRCSFPGLISRTKNVIEQDPLSGHLFVFLNRSCDYLKLLYWDESGYCIWSKRLEAGSFEFPKSAEEKVEVDLRKLLLILEGISLKNIKQRKRFSFKR